MLRLEPLSLTIALVPLAMYLMVLGLINLSRRPWLISGPRDTAALAVALSGMLVIGPFDLFLPHAAAARFGAFVWVLLGALYVFATTLLLFYQRPRMTIYNFTSRQLRIVLEPLAKSLDPDASWIGNHLSLPKLDVDLQVEPFTAMRNVSLVATPETTDEEGWKQLELALKAALRETQVTPNPRGLSFMFLAAAMCVVVLWNVAFDPASLVHDLRQLLRMESVQ